MRAKYKVYDDFGLEREFLGYANTWSECKEIAGERWEDTDGECYVVALPLNPETNKYSWAKCMRL